MIRVAVVVDHPHVAIALRTLLDEELPVHSSLSRILECFGLETFQRFFEQIVVMCIKVRLVWGEGLYLDSTKV